MSLINLALFNYFRNREIEVESEDIPDAVNSEGTLFWYRNGRDFINRSPRYPERKPKNTINITEHDDDEFDERRELNKVYIIHRENAPALIKINGTKKWYRNGLLHREDGPAIETSDGYKYYYSDGKRSRVDGPAIIRPDGSYEWWFEDMVHRDNDEPAVKTQEGSLYYYRNNKLHRENGPAQIIKNPEDINDIEYSWYYEGKLHRLDGPAYIDDLCVKWYINGTIQRVLWYEGSEENYNNGVLHSEDDKPALVIKSIQINSIRKSKQEIENMWYNTENHSPPLEKLLNLKRKFQAWYTNGFLDRKDKPAIIYSNGKEEFYEKGIKKEPHYPDSIQNTKITKKLPEEIHSEILSFVN
jgi:hypothetical protein